MRQKQKKNLGLVLFTFGLVLLIERDKLMKIGWIGFWPFFLLGPGLLFFFQYFLGISQKHSLAFQRELLIPGTLFTGSGLFLFAFSLEYLDWQDLSGLWPIFLNFLGLGFCLAYLVDRTDHGLLIPGGGFVLIGLVGLEFFYLKKRFILILILGILVLILVGIITYVCRNYLKKGRP